MDSYRIFKIRNFILLVPLFLIYVNVSYAAQTDRVVRIGIYNNHPLVSENTKGEPQGLFVDLINNIAAQENWKPVFIFDTFSNCLQRLKNHGLDLITAIAHTEKRDVFLDFSEEIVCTLWGIVMCSGNRKSSRFLI